jgi:hypothetical protein
MASSSTEDRAANRQLRFVASFRVNLIHDLLEDVDRRLVIAQQRQSTADFVVVLQGRPTRHTLGSVRLTPGGPQLLDHRDGSARPRMSLARCFGAMLRAQLWFVPT